MRFTLFLLIFSLKSFAVENKFSTYIDMASNNKLGMNSRWSSLVNAAGIAADGSDEDQLKQIKNFVNSKEWYLRNAAMIALSKINPLEAMIEAKKLLRDKALVVRSAAVEIISQNLTDEHKKLLIAELSKPYNFHKKNSLWIRKQIIEKLSTTAEMKDREVFAKSLFDQDKEISHISAKALERITGMQINETGFIRKWKIIVKENNWDTQ
ncbi:MAG: hypothetical protein AABY53_10295 [Bdellovibrionota bacterium]